MNASDGNPCHQAPAYQSQAQLKVRNVYSQRNGVGESFKVHALLHVVRGTHAERGSRTRVASG